MARKIKANYKALCSLTMSHIFSGVSCNVNIVIYTTLLQIPKSQHHQP